MRVWWNWICHRPVFGVTSISVTIGAFRRRPPLPFRGGGWELGSCKKKSPKVKYERSRETFRNKNWMAILVTVGSRTVCLLVLLGAMSFSAVSASIHHCGMQSRDQILAQGPQKSGGNQARFRVARPPARPATHSPDGIEIAAYDFDDADLIRRAQPHVRSTTGWTPRRVLPRTPNQASFESPSRSQY